jgi:predicted N-acetyltransferase YhbS
MDFILRHESTADSAAIEEMVRMAFLPLAYSSHTEEFMIRALRGAKMLSISLVAESGSRLIGHVAFSPVKISDGSSDWYGLGPLSVAPEFQRRGIGQALVRHGLDMLRERSAAGCVVFGDPNYYGRFGFSQDPEIIFEGAPAELFQVLKIAVTRARGKVAYHEAFNAIA